MAANAIRDYMSFSSISLDILEAINTLRGKGSDMLEYLLNTLKFICKEDLFDKNLWLK